MRVIKMPRLAVQLNMCCCLKREGRGEEGGDTRDGDNGPLFTPNPLFPQLSDAVQIKFARNRGRYAVAARDIKIGELVAMEKAFVSFLDKEQRLTNCWHCLVCTQARASLQARRRAGG